MKIKEQTLKEMETLNPKELMILYEIILTIKNIRKEYKPIKISSAYMRVRELLNDLKGSLSDDIILEREDRI